MNLKILNILSVVFYCTRIGSDYPGHFICTDKEESEMVEINLDDLPNQKVPYEWSRVRIEFSGYPSREYSLENYSNRYNDGTAF